MSLIKWIFLMDVIGAVVFVSCLHYYEILKGSLTSDFIGVLTVLIIIDVGAILLDYHYYKSRSPENKMSLSEFFDRDWNNDN